MPADWSTVLYYGAEAGPAVDSQVQRGGLGVEVATVAGGVPTWPGVGERRKAASVAAVLADGMGRRAEDVATRELLRGVVDEAARRSEDVVLTLRGSSVVVSFESGALAEELSDN